MKSINSIIVGVAAVTLVLPVFAATLIESTDGAGDNVAIRIAKDMARIDSSDLEGYMLMDMDKDKVYAVTTDEKIVIDLSLPAGNDINTVGAKPAGMNRPQAIFDKQGDGPEIAGYSTVHYKVMMGDTHCFDEYLSKQAIGNSEILRFIQMMARESQAREKMGMTEYFAADNPCETAEEVMDDQYLTLGIPLRTLDNHGVTIHEVSRIQNDVSFSDDMFELPEDFPVVTRAEMLQRALRQMPSASEGDMHDNPHRIK